MDQEQDHSALCLNFKSLAGAKGRERGDRWIHPPPRMNSPNIYIYMYIYAYIGPIYMYINLYIYVYFI